MIGIVGIVFFLGIAWSISTDPKRLSWRIVISGLLLQLGFALLVLGVPSLGIPGVLAPLFTFASQAVNAMIGYSSAGSVFLFGPMADGAKMGGFIFAVQVLPIIIFFSAVMAVLYHLGIMQRVVRLLAAVMNRVMGISGPESLAAAANVFVGQTEAPLIVKPYLKTMTRSELMCLMTGGMATVSGSVMAAYVQLLNERIPDIAGHLLTASVMSAPAAILFAKIMVPETELAKAPDPNLPLRAADDSSYANVIDAAATGASDGLKLALNVAAMLIAFIALVALVNGFLGFVSSSTGWLVDGKPWTLEQFLGILFTTPSLYHGCSLGRGDLGWSNVGRKNHS